MQRNSQLHNVYISNADTVVGYAIADELLVGKQREQFGEIVCTVKDVNYAGALRGKGATVIEMKDHNVPQWLPEYLHGRVNFCIVVPDLGSTQLVQQGKNVIDMCKKANCRRLVLLSLTGAEDKEVQVAKELFELEQHLHKASGFENKCVLRHTFFAQWLYWVAEEVREERKLMLPWKADARCAVLSLQDFVRVIPHHLTKGAERKSESKDHEIYNITGLKAITPSEIVNALGSALGEKIQFQHIDRQKMYEYLRKKQFNDKHANSHCDMFDLINKGCMNVITQEAEKSGTKPVTIEQWAKENGIRF